MPMHDLWRRSLVPVATLVLLLPALSPAARAEVDPLPAVCPPASVGGPAVGRISVAGVTVPIKMVSMTVDGALEAAGSNVIASVVSDYQGLDAKRGTTVLLWHSRYGLGCDGALNVFFARRVGTAFTVMNARGVPRRYVIRATATVLKGDYKAAWFRTDGPRQLTLVTCTGLVNDVFTQNYVITAVPA